jgi:nucleoside-diphosphate-sugar epimerase
MKVLVTGANGYLGRALCPVLLARGHAITTLTRQPWLLPGTTNHLFLKDDKARLDEALLGQEVIIHLAALAHQAGQETPAMRSRYWSVNVEQTKVLAQAAVKAGVKRFIYISSIKVNGESTSSAPYRYDDAPRPEDLYGQSKWAAEQMLRELLAGTDTELVIIRPPLIWGGAVKGNLALLQALVRFKVPLPFGRIQNRRDLVSLDNLCSLINVVIAHPKAAGKTLLVSDGLARTTADIIKLVAANAGKKANIVNCPLWVLRLLNRLPVIGGRLQKLTGNLAVDIAPTCELLNWQPELIDLKHP